MAGQASDDDRLRHKLIFSGTPNPKFVADYLVVLTGGHIQVMGEIAGLLADHAVLSGPAADADRLGQRFAVIHARRAGRQAQLLVRTPGAGHLPPPGWEAEGVTLEELVLAYLREPSAAKVLQPASLSPGR